MPHSDTGKSVADVFALAMEIERKAGNLYESLARMFPQEPGISTFWSDLKCDEDGHVQLLQNALDQLPPEIKVSAVDPSLWDKLAEMKLRIDRQARSEFLTLDDAYEFAHELEFSEINGVFKLLASGLTSGTTSMEIIEANISQHQDKLLIFARKFGDREWRRTIIADHT